MQNERKTVIEIIKDELDLFNTYNNDQEILGFIKESDQLDSRLTSGLTTSDLKVLSTADQLGETKISDIVDQVPLTQGAVSKIISKLVRRGIVAKFHQLGNHKDSFVKLTESGTGINNIYRHYHKQEEAEFKKISESFSKDDLEKITKFLKQVNEIRKKTSKKQ